VSEPVHDAVEGAPPALDDHVDRPMRFMAARLRRGEVPAQMMRLSAAEAARGGRNDPCTCGSGHKWKRCHGDPSR
jgi:uncharacterized protein YecA (UPF0149 family)